MALELSPKYITKRINPTRTVLLKRQFPTFIYGKIYYIAQHRYNKDSNRHQISDSSASIFNFLGTKYTTT